jgi:hypothetical protein
MTESLHPDNLLRRIAYIALWAYFFTVPFEYSFVLREPLESYARVTGELVLLVGTAAVIVTGRARRWKAFHWLALLYLLLVSISLLWDQPSGSASASAFMGVCPQRQRADAPYLRVSSGRPHIGVAYHA